MRKSVIIVFVVAATAAVGAALLVRQEGGALAPASAPQLIADLYPLYAGVVWSAPQMQELQLATTTVSGVAVESAPVSDTMDTAAVSTPFEQYYAQKLSALGWRVDTSLQANGPGSGMSVYRKDGGLIVLRYVSIFHDVSSTSPEQCPCDVTLSLFSADGNVATTSSLTSNVSSSAAQQIASSNANAAPQ